MIVTQNGTAGAAGSNGATPGAGGTAGIGGGDALAAANAAGDTTNRSTATGGAGGSGGSGANAAGGAGGSAGAGGAGGAAASTAETGSASATTLAEATATGGSGGSAGSPGSGSPAGIGANGGAGGAATAGSKAASNTASASAISVASGGAGGSATGAGGAGGAGGGATAQASASGFDAGAYATVSGGTGGAGYGGAAGGRGSDVTVVDAVGGRARGGRLTLSQQAIAGNGGGSNAGKGGDGGNSSSQFTFDDIRTNGAAATTLEGNSIARGGAGGGGATGQVSKGGNATAAIALTGAGAVAATARAVGGNTGTIVTAGPVTTRAGSNATAIASARTTSATLTATATADAVGGRGGQATGAGNTAGGGGSATGAKADATGQNAEARVRQEGGAGGDGLAGARGGAGAASTIINQVQGSAPGGSLSLTQQAFGGSGGQSTGGLGGTGGAASTTLQVDETASAASAAFLTTSLEGGGGGGGSGTTGSGAGGTATATLQAKGRHTVQANAQVRGGTSGNVADGGTANGTAGGAVSGSVTAVTVSTSESAFASLQMTGGNGGAGRGAGRTGGSGGGVGTVSVFATGAMANASVGIGGGAGGAGTGGANGGTGASVTVTDAVSVRATYRAASAFQGVAGGAGGYSIGGTGGAGGKGTSNLTLDDTIGGGSGEVSAGANGYGGNGGDSTVAAGKAGAGAATANIRGALNVTSFANAVGGGAGRVNAIQVGTGGAAQATSNATATEWNGVAIARAHATGGSGAAKGDANAQANATAGAFATAEATADGGSGQVTSNATTFGTGILTSLTTSAAAAVSGSKRTASHALSSFSDAFAGSTYDAYSFGTVLPSAFSIDSALTSAPTVDAQLGTTTAEVVGTGVIGASHSAAGSGTVTRSGLATWTLNTTASSGHLILGLLGHETLAGGFANLRLTVSVGGSTVATSTFSTLSVAEAFFDDHVLDLGAVAALPVLTVSIAYALDMDTANSGFGFSYILGTTNGGSDTVGPLAPSVHLQPSSDAGASHFDRLTNQTVPSFTGQAEARSTVALFDGATLIATTTADAGGRWDVMPSGGLSQGTHSMTAKATDAAGNTGLASTPLVFTIDTAAPPPPSAPDLVAASDSGVSGSDNLTNLRSLAFSGMAEAFATVALVENGGEIDHALADATGAWSINPATRFTEGVHTFTARAVDLAGNIGADSAALTVTVDLTSATPTTPDLLSGSDTGRSQGDNVTSLTTPSFGGKAEAGATVTLMDGTTVVGTGTASGVGSWTAKTSVLAEGQHVLTAIATDKAGNVSATSAALTITVDTTAPAQPPVPILAAASDTGPSATDGITRDTTPTLSGTAEAGAMISLFDGAAPVPIATTTASPAGTWTITTVALVEGTHPLFITATDLAGNVSVASAARQVTIDLSVATPAAPAMTATSDSGTSPSDGITNDTTPDFTGTTEAFATVTLLEGATVLGSGTADAAGIWVVTSKALAAGVHSVTAKVTDLAGNGSASSAATAVTIDVSAPSAPSTPDLIAASDSGTSSTDNLTNVVTPVFSGKAEADATVTLFDGATSIGSVKASGAGTWSVTSAALAQGSHTITAKATDAAGNTGIASGAVTVTVDTAAPAVPSVPDLNAASDTGVSSTDNITQATAPIFSGKGDAGAIITLLEGAVVLGSVTANAQGAWSITSSTLAAGLHAISATAADKAGNVSASTAVLLVTVDTATSIPGTPDLATASDNGLSATDNITNVATPTLTGKAEAGAAVTLFSAAVTGSIGRGVADAAGDWSIKTLALADGSHVITAKAVDVAGNASAASAGLTVLIDTIAPATPSISSVTPAAISGLAEAGTTVTVTDGAATLGSALADAGGTWTLTLALTEGVHALGARATDVAGNISATTPVQTVTMGTAGDDVLGTAGADRAVGGAGDDLYLVDEAGDVVVEVPGEGSDIVQASVGYTLPAASAIEFLLAVGAAGLALGGNERSNTISGGTGADTLSGGGGGDRLIGGAGIDIFRYTALSDSQDTAGQRDAIFDFDEAAGEKLDLSALDADALLAGDQAFAFLGSGAFTGAAGQVRFAAAGANTAVTADVNGDLNADFTVLLAGSHALGAGNFVL